MKMDEKELGWDSLNWIEQAQYRVTWRTLLYDVMKFRVPKTRGIS
jgi:hypothetical protein